MTKARYIATFGFGLTLSAMLTAAVVTERSGDVEAPERPAPEGMVYVDDADYLPLYADPSDREAQPVSGFYLDRYPVTNGDFLAFVSENSSWRRSEVKSIFADEGYLRHWQGDLELGPKAEADRPVVNVSWFAAQTYAEWTGRRLPTTAEWEVAADAGGAGAEESERASAYRQSHLAWYGRPISDGLPAVESAMCNERGICGLHGLVWEWVEDFNSSLVTGESRNDGDLDLGLFCGNGAVGASDFTDYTAFLRFGFRSGLQARYTVSSLGFRTAADVSDTAYDQTF